jgi:L-lactate dehydrogenase complex protein LldG
MSGREAVLGKVRRALGVSGGEAERRSAVAARLDAHTPNVIPARGQLPRDQKIELFQRMAEKVSATVRRLDSADDVPAAIAEHLRNHNLPARFRIGDDPLLAALPWDRAPNLERLPGASDGHDAVSLSRAFAGVAESGTLVLLSGQDNPTTLNFLPDTHIVVVSADDIAGDYEAVWARIRTLYGPHEMPRTVNLVTGPSRSADIEQTLILGAHGPRALHILVVDSIAPKPAVR